MVTVIISSTQDPASTNIKQGLLSESDWKETAVFFDAPVYEHQQLSDLYLVTIKDKTIIHEHLVEQLHDELNINTTQAIFISRHRSKTGRPSLTTHPIGNFGDALFGGRKRTLSPSLPHLMTEVLRSIHWNATKKNLKHQVCFEVTHHGPYMSIPALFVEVGSNQQEWEKPFPASIVAQSLMETIVKYRNRQDKYNETPVVIGIGGGHYAPRFTDVALVKNVSFGHMIPSYHIDNDSIDDEILEQTIEMTPLCQGVYIHRKALKKSQVSFFKQWCQDHDIRVFSSNDFITRS